MSKTSGSPATFSHIQQAHADTLYRDVNLINEAVRAELGPMPLTRASSPPRRKPTLPIHPRPVAIADENLQETDEVSLKHLTAAVAIATLGLAACQKQEASPPSVEKREVEQVAPVPATDMQAAAEAFASDKGRDWDAYATLSTVKWKDSVPQEFVAGRYSRSGEILLQGFTTKDIPNGKPGTEYATVKRNEGESTLNVTGTLSGVETVSISKPLYSDDYLSILKNQFGSAAAVATIADQCPAPEYEEGAGSGAFFEVSLAGNRKLYVQASQKDGGKYTDGFTVFDLTRTRPTDAIAQLNCKPVE